MSNSINIIIVNWNSGNYLHECINSIKNSDQKALTVRIIVVDNASKDNSLDLIDKKDIQLIKNKYNLGFAKACNQGVIQSKSKYVLFLNPDTRLFTRTLKSGLEFMERNQDIDVLGCKHLDKNGKIHPSCSSFPSTKNFVFDIIGLSRLAPRLFQPSTIMTDWDHAHSRDVDQVMGAFMLIRRDVLNKVGLFDENFFVYFEDMDLSKRIKGSGGRVYYNSDIEIFHEGGGTSKQIKATRLVYSLKSRLFYVRKHMKKWDFYIVFFLTLFIEPISRIIFSMILFRLNNIKNTIIGYGLLFKSLIMQGLSS